MCPYHARMSSPTEMYVDSTRSGILEIKTLADMDSDSENSCGEDSEINKNLEICQLEKRYFDDKKETKEDV
jgi:hypothetical protein